MEAELRWSNARNLDLERAIEAKGKENLQLAAEYHEFRVRSDTGNDIQLYSYAVG